MLIHNSSSKELGLEKGICCNEKVQNWIISDEKSGKGSKQPTRTMNKDRTEGGSLPLAGELLESLVANL